MADGAGEVDATEQALLLLQGARDTEGEAVKDLLNQRRALQKQKATLNNQLQLAKRKQARALRRQRAAATSSSWR